MHIKYIIQQNAKFLRFYSYYSTNNVKKERKGLHFSGDTGRLLTLIFFSGGGGGRRMAPQQGKQREQELKSSLHFLYIDSQCKIMFATFTSIFNTTYIFLTSQKLQSHLTSYNKCQQKYLRKDHPKEDMMFCRAFSLSLENAIIKDA